MSNMNEKDASDTLFENEDLLSILGADPEEDKSSASSGMTSEEETEATNKLKQLTAMASELETTVSGANPGSGDIDEDIKNWFNGDDKLPSDKLNAYIGNPMIKMDYGMTRTTLGNYERMGTLGKFLDSSFELLFSDTAAMGLMPDELEERTKLAFTMYKELGALNQRTVMGIKDNKIKTNGESDEVDKLSLLLSSIPTDKLKSLLMEISSSTTK